MDALWVPSDLNASAAVSPTPLSEVLSLQEVLGRSAACQTLIAQIRKMAATDASVLIEGETGSGKELAARALHYLGPRRDKPFVPINCGALPDTLIEAELFGHVRGSFTDAKHNRVGVVAYANGGTLFLDEVDTLPAKGQVALLRFLQDRSYRPVGHCAERTADVRVIAASNQPMQALMARDGGFRSDLLYRLSVLWLHVPPLRERIEDILPLAEHFLARFCAHYRRPRKRLHPGTVEWLQRYDWPGNIRELENLIHRLILLSDDEIIEFTGEWAECSDARLLSFHDAKARAVNAFERSYLIRIMAATEGNVSAAARLACKERRALGRLLKKHGIDKNAYRA